MKESPLVSVIIPCYNCETYIEKAVISILKQTYTNIEILITDDCSSDNTYEIILKLAEIDSRIKVFKNSENSKIVKTLNNMVSLAKGDYIVRMDADDISDPKRIEKQILFLENNPDIDFCGTNALYIDKTDRIIGKSNLPIKYEDIVNLQKYYSVFNHPSMCFRNYVLKENPYSNDYPYAEDYELWSRLLFLKKLKAVNLSENLLYYRFFAEQSSSKYKTIQADSVKSIMQKYNGILNENIDYFLNVNGGNKIIINQLNDLLGFLKKYFNEINMLPYNYQMMSRYFLFCYRNKLYKPLIGFVMTKGGIKTLFCVFKRKIIKKFKIKRIHIYLSFNNNKETF